MENSKYIGYRPTWAEVNLGNLAHNYKQIRRLVAPKTKIMVTVKADAYGHGLIPVSKRLESCGVDFLGVASIDEAIELRKAGIKKPILVLGLILKKDIDPVFKYKLSIAICDKDLAAALNRKAISFGQKVNLHIKVDTGMGRIGILQKDALGLIKKIEKLKGLKIEGIFTHFALADMNKSFTLFQIGLFNRLLAELKKEGINIPFVHAANSMGIIDYKESHFNMVRPGLIIYGLYPKENLNLNLRPLLSLKSKIVFIKQVPKGVGISYGHTYVTKKKSTIVTLPIGYGDGYPRNLSNKGLVLIGGRRFKVSGTVCMDQLMVDVGNLKVKIGQEAVLIGTQGKNKITTEELAVLSKTIPYEIVCGLGSRIPRIYNY